MDSAVIAQFVVPIVGGILGGISPLLKKKRVPGELRVTAEVLREADAVEGTDYEQTLVAKAPSSIADDAREMLAEEYSDRVFKDLIESKLNANLQGIMRDIQQRETNLDREILQALQEIRTRGRLRFERLR